MTPLLINTRSARLSEEQFFMLCADNNELRIERDKNKNILLMSPTGAFTGRSHSDIMRQLANWNYTYKLGEVFDSSSGFTLPNGAIRAPDAAWISRERWAKVPQHDKERFAHICPDFIIEVRSKSDSLKQQQEKMEEWMENGCRLGWLIDLEHKTTYRYKPGRKVIKQSFIKRMSGENVLPEFELNLKEIIIGLTQKLK
ncbi:MAG: Uma2 family endonuclease [Bacteroidota bacterium]